MVPYRADDDLEQDAKQFLTQHHPNGTIPIPIEEIIEFNMGIEIQPIRGLRDRYNIDGFLSSNRRTIVVDEHQMEHGLNRYRFTLAHELGHLVIHSSAIDQVLANVNDVSNWREAIKNISAGDYARMEHQAYRFAGYLLVPTTDLINAVNAARVSATANGVDLSQMGDAAIDALSRSIGKQFDVSSQVISRRLTQEQLP